MFQKRETKQEDAKKSSNWKKQGDISRRFNSGAPLDRKVEYYNEKKDELGIYGYGSIDKIQIAFHTKNSELLKNIRVDYDQSDLPPRDPIGEIIGGEIRLQVDNDKPSLAKFLNILDKHIFLGSRIKKDIFNALGLKQIADVEGFHKELRELVDASKFDDALKKALSVEDDDVVWELGQYCESKQRLEEAVRCYENIPSDNPHYKQANEQMAHILMQIDAVASAADSENAASSLDEEEAPAEHKDTVSSEGIKKKLMLMFKAENTPENQRWIDITYHQLSGGTGLNPAVTNVKPDPQTLFALAEQIASQQQEILRLKMELDKASKKTANTTKTLFSEPTDNKRSKGPGSSLA